MANEARKPSDEEQPQPMSQAEIDALFAELAKADAKQEEQSQLAEAAPTTGIHASQPAASGTQSVLGQTEIDLLLQGETPAQPAQQAVATPTSSAPENAALGQADIDALINQMGGEAAPSSPAAQTAAPSGSLGQDDIDSLLAQMNAGDPQPAPAPAAEPAPEPQGEGPRSQDDIDAILREMGAIEEPKPEPVAAPAGPLGQDDIDALLAQMGATGEQKEPVSEAPAPATALGQDDIDQLLAELGSEGAAPKTTANAAGSGSEGGRLTTEQIEAIVRKQETGEAPSTVAETSAEAMISQSDIDALVRQMSMATAVLEEPGAAQAEATLVNPQHDIDALLNQVRSSVDVSDPVQTMAAPVALSVPSEAALVAPDELRGARWLLVAAVFLLTLCSATLAFIAKAINGLSAELHAGRTAQALPQDGYDKDVAVGRELLSSEDPVNVVKGLQFFDRMKRIYPERRLEIGMILADHHRSREAWQRSVDEYRAINEQYGDFLDNPRIDLDHADSLFQLGRIDDALVVINRLLANESRFAQALDDQGRPRPDAAVRAEREMVQRAYLLLGRLYTAQIERLPTAGPMGLAL